MTKPSDYADVDDFWSIVRFRSDGFWHLDLSKGRRNTVLYTFNAQGRLIGLSSGTHRCMLSLVADAERKLGKLRARRVRAEKAKQLLEAHRAIEKDNRKKQTRN